MAELFSIPVGMDDAVDVESPAMVTSTDVLEWLTDYVSKFETQEDAAAQLGTTQSNIAKILTKDKANSPIDTIAKYAAGAGYKRLSEFFLALELGTWKSRERATLHSPTHGKVADTSTIPKVQSTTEPLGGSLGDSLPVPRELYAQILRDIGAAVYERAALYAQPAPDHGSARSDSPPGKTGAGEADGG
jgi:hypothetical protein